MLRYVYLKSGKDDAPKELSYRTYYRHKHLSMLKFLVLSAAAGTISHPLDAPPLLTCAEYQQCFDPLLFLTPPCHLSSRCVGGGHCAVARSRGLHNPKQVRLYVLGATPRQSNHLLCCNIFLLYHDASIRLRQTVIRSSHQLNQ